MHEIANLGSIGARPTFRNRLLAALTPDALAALRPHLLGPVELAQGQTLHVRGHPVAEVFFPEAGLASLTAGTPDGDVEVGLTGREGLVGAAVLLDPVSSPDASSPKRATEISPLWRAARGELRASG